MTQTPQPHHHHTAAEERVGLVYAAAAAIIYGAAYPATAIALTSFTPLAVAGIACTIALALVVVLAWARVLPRPGLDGLEVPRLARLLTLSGLGGVGFIAATNLAVALSGSTVTGFVTPLYAVAAAVLAVPILGERLHWTSLAAFAVAIVGTALLAGDLPNLDAAVGVGVALVAAVLFGLYIVLARRWAVPYRLDGTLVTIVNLIGRGPILLAVEAVRGGGSLVPPDPDPAALLAILVIAIGPSSAANLLLMASVRRVPASRTSAALLLTPISSAVIGAVLLSDHLAPIQLVGAALILVGIAVASGVVGARRGRETARPAADPGPG